MGRHRVPIDRERCERFRELIKTNKIKQNVIAERVGVTPQTISLICRAQQNLTEEMARKFETAFPSFSAAWLLGYSDNCRHEKEDTRTRTKPKWLAEYTEDGCSLRAVYQIVDVHDDVYVLEFLEPLDIELSGSFPPEEEIGSIENVYEMRLSELKNPRLFYTWYGVIGEYARHRRRSWNGSKKNEA